jgi:hypothetical protein
MKHLLIILSFLLLSSPVIGQSDEKCYVVVESSKDFDPSLLSNISISLISKYLREVDPIPPEGVSTKSCQYLVSVSKINDTTFVTFKGDNLNSYGDSKLSGSDGFQQSILKSLFRSLKNQRNLICDDYGKLLDECEEFKEGKNILSNSYNGNKKKHESIFKSKSFVVGRNGTVYVSVNSTDWEKITSRTQRDLKDISFGNGTFIILSWGDNLIYSKDLKKWSPLKTGYSGTKTQIIFGRSNFIIVGHKGIILNSTNGMTWNKSFSGTKNDLNFVIFSENRYVTVGKKGTIITSMNGLDWNDISINVNYNIKKIVFTNNQYIILAIENNKSNLLKSNNLLQWEKIDTDDNLKDLSFGNNKILTISESNDIGIVSNTGLVKITSLRNKRINQLTFKDDFFYILGNGGLIMRSKNGLKWTEIVTNTNNDLLRLK